MGRRGQTGYLWSLAFLLPVLLLSVCFPSSGMWWIFPGVLILCRRHIRQSSHDECLPRILSSRMPVFVCLYISDEAVGCMAGQRMRRVLRWSWEGMEGLPLRFSVPRSATVLMHASCLIPLLYAYSSQPQPFCLSCTSHDYWAQCRLCPLLLARHCCRQGRRFAVCRWCRLCYIPRQVFCIVPV